MKTSSSTAVTGCVRGRVQGVSFRYSMQRKAVELGVTGWVRNLPDRSVAFHGEGTPQAVESLVNWSRVGPVIAGVDSVDVTPCEIGGFDTFEILP